jgi:hypothetical protein
MVNMNMMDYSQKQYIENLDHTVKGHMGVLADHFEVEVLALKNLDV